MTAPRALIAEDEPLLAAALQQALAQAWPELQVQATVGDGLSAVRQALALRPEVLFFDIRMPGLSGLDAAAELADAWDTAARPFPALVFVTAYDQYAVQAFELAAVDYLLKPVRAQRLAEALERVRVRRVPPAAEALATLAAGERGHFSVAERGRILLVPVAEVLYLRAELKYVTARTAAREYVLDESLVQIEQEFPRRFLRLHRNCLVALAAVAGVERAAERDGQKEGEREVEPHWEVLLRDLPERLPVSRRQWPAVRQALGI